MEGLVRGTINGITFVDRGEEFWDRQESDRQKKQKESKHASKQKGFDKRKKKKRKRKIAFKVSFI